MANITVRPAKERGHTNFGWLDSFHSFSFGEYEDPAHMGFRTLRVINDDTVEPDHGFGSHRHRDMEIISYVVEGELQHKDSLGNGSAIKPGNFQRMTAGRGVIHSEFNPSKKNKVHFLQIWILPAVSHLDPSYQELSLASLASKKGLRLIGSDKDDEKLIRIHQDVKLFKGDLGSKEKIDVSVEKGRAVWIQMIKGKVEVLGVSLSQGDGASIENEKKFTITAKEAADFLVFDLK